MAECGIPMVPRVEFALVVYEHHHTVVHLVTVSQRLPINIIYCQHICVHLDLNWFFKYFEFR